MKRSDRKYFRVFLVFISLLNPVCNPSRQDAAALYSRYMGTHLATFKTVTVEGTLKLDNGNAYYLPAVSLVGASLKQ
jgi:hypothetical protein